MIHRDIKTLSSLGSEIHYIDELTGERIAAIVGKIEKIDDFTVFVYAVSPYKDENTKQEGTLFFRDIIVFDDKPEIVNGIHKDYIRAQKEKNSIEEIY